MSSAQDHAAQPREESLEELHQALTAAQRRLGYFEKFEGLIEQQMQALSERAAAIDRETGQEQERQAQRLVELHQEAQSLREACQHRREEIAVLSRHAQGEAVQVVDEARQVGAAIIATTITRLRELLEEIAQAAESQSPGRHGGSVPSAADREAPRVGTSISTPAHAPSAPETVSEPSVPGGFEPTGASVRETPAEREMPQEREYPPPVVWPVEAPSTSPELPSKDLEIVVTRLSVRGAPDDQRLVALRSRLEKMPGVRRVNAVSTSGDTSHLDVAHTVDSSLLGNLLAIDELDFHLIRRGEASLEIEIF